MHVPPGYTGFTYVEVQKTAPLRNGNSDYSGYAAAGPVGLSNLSNPVTFVESGPSSNANDYTGANRPGLHSYANSSSNYQVVNSGVTLQPYTGYYYYSQFTPSYSRNPPTPLWTAAGCDPSCGFYTVYDIGAVTSLPYIGSNAETLPEAENLGGTVTSNSIYSVEGDSNTHNWCFDQSLIFSKFSGANFTTSCTVSAPIWGIYWTHD